MAAITSAISAGVGTAMSIGMTAAKAAGAFAPDAPEQEPGVVPGPQGPNPMAQAQPQPAFAGRAPAMDPLKDPFGGGMPGGGGWV